MAARYGRKLFVPVIIAVSIAVALSGCGGDTDRAKSDINSGDNMLLAVKTQETRLSTGINKLLDSVSKAIKEGKKPGVAAFEKGAAAVMADAEAVKKAQVNAAREYRAASKLENAGDYAKYASYKLQSSELTLKGLDYLEKYLKDAGALVKSRNFNAEQFLKTTESAGQALEETGKKVEALQKQAENLGGSHKL